MHALDSQDDTTAKDDQDDPTEEEDQWRQGLPFTVLDRIYLTTWAGIVDGGGWLPYLLWLEDGQEAELYPPLTVAPYSDGCVEKTAAMICPDDPGSVMETAFRILFQQPLYITPTSEGLRLNACLCLEDWWPDHPIVGCLDARAVGVNWGTWPDMKTLLGAVRATNAATKAAAERRRERDEEAMAGLAAFLEDHHRTEAVTRPVEGAEGAAPLPHLETAGRVSGTL
jgi:hypothetical protein